MISESERDWSVHLKMMTFTHILAIGFIVVNFCEATTVTKQVTSPFDLRNYNNTCEPTDNQTASSDCEPCEDFDAVVKTAMLFACAGHEEYGNLTMYLATLYTLKWRAGPTYGAIMSVKTIDLLKQFTQIYYRITFYRTFLAEVVNETTEVRNKINYFNLETTTPPAKNKTDQLLSLVDDYILNIWAVKNLTLKYGMENIFFTELYTSDILNETKFIEFRDILNKSLPSEKFVSTVKLGVFQLWPTFVGVTFAVGIIANGVLLLIFVRHSEMRTVHNVMLANLALMDLISLIFNLPLTYILYSKPWYFNLMTCQFFLFLRSLTLGICTYSVVLISFQRLSAVSKFKAKRTTRLSSTMLALALWFVAVVYSIPAFFFASTDQQFCKYNESVYMYYSSIDFVVMCLVPAILVAVFSIMASMKLKESAHNIPGERMGQEKRIRDRIVTSRVLIGLVVIFVLSYIPRYLLDILITGDPMVRDAYRNFTSDDYGTHLVLALFCETVLFLNPALNPLVLYFLSTKFKKYFNNYLLCRCRSEVS